MFEENITTLINNKMTVNQWQIIYDSFTMNQDSNNDTNQNHVNA
jgi:hypothetical protein